jgi:hypothetical protein
VRSRLKYGSLYWGVHLTCVVLEMVLVGNFVLGKVLTVFGQERRAFAVDWVSLWAASARLESS